MTTRGEIVSCWHEGCFVVMKQSWQERQNLMRMMTAEGQPRRARVDEKRSMGKEPEKQRVYWQGCWWLRTRVRGADNRMDC